MDSGCKRKVKKAKKVKRTAERNAMNHEGCKMENEKRTCNMVVELISVGTEIL